LKLTVESVLGPPCAATIGGPARLGARYKSHRDLAGFHRLFADRKAMVRSSGKGGEIFVAKIRLGLHLCL